MSEFDAYNKETGEWETFSISEYIKIRKDKRYGPINVCIDSI